MARGDTLSVQKKAAQHRAKNHNHARSADSAKGTRPHHHNPRRRTVQPPVSSDLLTCTDETYSHQDQAARKDGGCLPPAAPEGCALPRAAPACACVLPHRAS